MASAFGLSIKITDKIFVFSEVSMFNMSYSSTMGKMTTYKENGQDLLNDRPAFFREESFKGEITFINSIDVSKPREVPTITYPMSSIGLNIGLKISL